MRNNFLENDWGYEIHDIMIPKNYGFSVDIYKNNKKITTQGGFGSIQGAKVWARDYFLFNEFGIEKENKI